MGNKVERKEMEVCREFNRGQKKHTRGKLQKKKEKVNYKSVEKNSAKNKR